MRPVIRNNMSKGTRPCRMTLLLVAVVLGCLAMDGVDWCSKVEQGQPQHRQGWIILGGGVHALEDSLYQILGVPRQASTSEIKRAYRKKALDTHPDKNPDVPPEQSAEAFHKVVEAFEVLSDPSSRRQYDRSGRVPTSGGNNNGNRGGGGQWYDRSSNTFTFKFNYQQQRRQPRMKDQPDVKRAQSRLMHIVSWEQFQTVLIEQDDDDDDDDYEKEEEDNEEPGDRLERNVLLAAVNPHLERYVMDEMVFPYPFAGMSPQNIWWEDILQTVLIRYHNSNELTQKLKLPLGQDLGTSPIFLFGREGQRMDEPWARIQTRSRTELQTWVWEQISVKLEFVNYHDHAVEIYWIDGTRAHLKVERLEPGASVRHNTRLTHEWYIRDVRVDAFPDSPGRHKITPSSTLLVYKVLDATSPHVVAIPQRTCFDLSGHCMYWARQSNGQECTLGNPNFMKINCRLTCGYCSDEQDQIHVEEAQDGTYKPPSQQQQKDSSSQPVHDEL